MPDTETLLKTAIALGLITLWVGPTLIIAAVAHWIMHRHDDELVAIAEAVEETGWNL